MNEQVNADIKFYSDDQSTSMDCHPWMSQHTQSIPNPIVRFHNQIIDFANYVQPSSQQHQNKLRLLLSIQMQIKKKIPHSFITSPLLKHKLYLKSTQISIYIILKQLQQNWQQNCIDIMRSIAQQIGLKIFNLSIQSSQYECRIISQQQKTQTQVWIHFVPQSWKLFINQIDNSTLMYPQIKYLYLITYCMVRQRALQTSITSLFIYGLCSFFLYQRRKQRIRTLTQNVIKFLQFYSISFIQDKQRKVIYMEGNIYNYNVNADKIFKFQIADQVDLANRKIRDFFKVIHNRYRVLGNYYYAPGTSILTHLINPCMGKFFY